MFITGKIKRITRTPYAVRQLFKAAMAACQALFFFSSSAQDVLVEANLDTAKLLIGDQARITLQATFPKSYRLHWASVPDTFNSIEVIQRSTADTLAKEPNYTIRQSLLITSFDSGYHVIPPFTFFYNKPGDTTTYSAETEALLATVYTLPVDTTQAIRDIKEPMDVPYTLLEFILDYFPYIAGLMVLGAAIVLLHYFLTRKKTGAQAVPEILKPPHVLALEELELLRDQQLWQKGMIKEYHSRISEITRTYLERKFRFPAMEQTTDEIIEKFSYPASPELGNKLRSLLQLTDLVKFAKAAPLPAENDLSLEYAFAIVKETNEAP